METECTSCNKFCQRLLQRIAKTMNFKKYNFLLAMAMDNKGKTAIIITTIYNNWNNLYEKHW